MHFALYEYSVVTESGERMCYRSIVLKNSFNDVLYFTKLEQYAGKFNGKYHRWNKKSLQHSKNALQYICKALNYLLIESYEWYKVYMVSQITTSMVLDFFQEYAKTEKPYGGYRLKQSILNCTIAVSHFFANVSLACDGFAKVEPSDLLIEKQVQISRKNHHTKSIYAPVDYEKAVNIASKPIFRDIPMAALKELIELSQIHTPEITFCIICQVCAGLRPSEALNLRQDTSPLGPSIYVSLSGSSVMNVEFNLRQELVLRSDNIRVGGIKKKRVQQMPSKFIEDFMKGKAFHEYYLKGKEYELDYSPMFFCRNGKAMTYDLYQEKFQNLVYKYLRPAMLNSSEPKLQIFGHRLQTEELSPHSLRHSFTVKLVLLKTSVEMLQYYRGDTSPESASWYLNNKGELDKLASAAHEDALSKIIQQP